jgi:hypothetical protein
MGVARYDCRSFSGTFVKLSGPSKGRTAGFDVVGRNPAEHHRLQERLVASAALQLAARVGEIEIDGGV